jgi:phosphate:Na+ symporter
MSFTEKRLIPLNAALALIIGANIGTALNPFIEGSRGGDAAGWRVVVGNVVTRLVGAAIALPALPPIGIGLVQIEPNFPRAVADFNVVLVLAFLPLLDPLAGVLERLMPQRLAAADPARPLYLDDEALETPSIALGHAAREALRMSTCSIR